LVNIYQPPFPPTGGGGGGGRFPSSPQHACTPLTSSEIAWGVQEKRAILRKTVTKINVIFFILFYLKIDTSVAIRIIFQSIFLWQHIKLKRNSFHFFEKCGAQKYCDSLLLKWPLTIHCVSSSSITMFCKPCYTQGGIAILKQIKQVWPGKHGKEMESCWKRFSTYFPFIFVVLKN
jgi:hypothetical protein